jgi:hypothetical protein
MSSQVDVHARTLQSRHRLRPANGKQDPLHVTEFTEAAPWWSLDRWLNWETLTVAGREVKGFVVSPFAAGLVTTIIGVLLAASITVTVGLYSSMSTQIQDQRDMLIEMKTRLEERTNAAKEVESKRDREQHDAEETAKVFREKMGERMYALEKETGVK